jgi:predicted restriction endonuclease
MMEPLKDGEPLPYKDPEKKLERQRLYRQEHLEALRAREKTYRQDHAETIRERAKTYRQNHPEVERNRQTRYRHARRDIIRERHRAWEIAHPAIEQARCARRRARKRSLPATLTGEQWRAIQRAYHHRCAYCGKRSHKLTQDHVIPLTKGGGTTPDNIVPACLSCNSGKCAGPPPSLPALRLML